MGAGNRFKFYKDDELAIGFVICQFPFQLTVRLLLGKYVLEVGIGKPYTD